MERNPHFFPLAAIAALVGDWAGVMVGLIFGTAVDPQHYLIPALIMTGIWWVLTVFAIKLAYDRWGKRPQQR